MNRKDMIFEPQHYKIKDEPHVPFIDTGEIEQFLKETAAPSLEQVAEVVGKALDKKRLSLRETALLLNAREPQALEMILSGARKLKQEIYGNRIVLFAPLYIGNRCVNSCVYCGFRRDNKAAVRRTLSHGEIVRETEALEDAGHKRLILVYGEHPLYDAEYIAHTVEVVYGVKKGNGEIRRVNINAAPLSTEDFRTVKTAGIGTYQIFQETYHEAAYKRCHPAGPKSDYAYRLTALDRAMEAGIDDVGLGALFGLHDWRFEVMALVRHTNHLEACYGVGPHTISFPRIKDASDVRLGRIEPVSDEDFIRLVAVLRLAVPYAGLILTAREPAALRDRLIEFGISQIDGGTKLEIGGYSAAEEPQNLDREQFQLNDGRSLGEVVDALVDGGRLPSFCTACYRKGRTGEHFMEFSVQGFIKRFCGPNALLTFAEYLEDYASSDRRAKGWAMIDAELGRMAAEGETARVEAVRERLQAIRSGKRDLLF